MGSGAELARGYWQDVVEPLLRTRWPRVPVAAARLGDGSDVLGFDDDTSRDHDWGLRLTVCVGGADGVGPQLPSDLSAHLQTHLPERYAGLPTRFEVTWDEGASHRVECTTVADVCMRRLGVERVADAGVEDWLSFTGQSVLEVTAGPVFVDEPGLLTATRLSLAWYPDDVWRYVVAAAWNQVDQDLPSVGRAGHVGDEPGSRLVASRVCSTAVHLAFLLSRSWPPYGKWRGTALRRLPVARDLEPALDEVSRAPDWPTRQRALATLLDVCRRLQRDVGLPVGPCATRPFHDRPFLELDPGLVAGLVAGVRDPAVRGLPAGVGSVEQWVDAVDVLVVPHRRRAAVRAVLGVG